LSKPNKDDWRQLTEFSEAQFPGLNFPFEVVDSDPIYQRIMFISGRTTELVYFQEPFRHLSDGNMYLAGMLPNPQAFLVEKIQIEGVTSQLKHAACQFIIGNKIYGCLPAWTLALKGKGLVLRHRLLIRPLVNFQFRILWPEPVYLGQGLDGAPSLYHPLTVVLFGSRLRPIA
jgi:hypothetical protein